MISNIIKGYKNVALLNTEIIYNIKSNEIILNIFLNKNKKNLEIYLLWYKKFNYFDLEKIWNIYKIIIFGKLIKILSKIFIYKIYIFIKIKNLI